MTLTNALILVWVVPLAAYIIPRIASSAYFRSKLEYNIKLMRSLTEGEKSNG